MTPTQFPIFSFLLLLYRISYVSHKAPKISIIEIDPPPPLRLSHL